MLREVERGPLHARLVANGKSRKSLDLFWGHNPVPYLLLWNILLWGFSAANF